MDLSKADLNVQVINGEEIEWKLPKHHWNTYGAFIVRQGFPRNLGNTVMQQ